MTEFLERNSASEVCLGYGADPSVFIQNENVGLLIQQHIDDDPRAHQGLSGYTLRFAACPEELIYAPVIRMPPVCAEYTQVWGFEVNSLLGFPGAFLYGTASVRGINDLHRPWVIYAPEGLPGPLHSCGSLVGVDSDRWRIDTTIAIIEGRNYAVSSVWPDGFASDTCQAIEIAELADPRTIKRCSIIAYPDECPQKVGLRSILEGPQVINIAGEFLGLTVSVNFSGKTDYTTSILKYQGGDPLNKTNWEFRCCPFASSQQGQGHGSLLDIGPDKIYWFYHQKTQLQRPGWMDRKIYYQILPISTVLTALD